MDDMYIDDAFTCVGKVIIGSECDNGNAMEQQVQFLWIMLFAVKVKIQLLETACDDVNLKQRMINTLIQTLHARE